MEDFKLPQTPKKSINDNSWLNDSEGRQSQDSRLILPSVAKRAGKKPHPVRNFIIQVLILAGIGYGGYLAYQAFWPKPAEPVQQQPENFALPEQGGDNDAAVLGSGTENLEETATSASSTLAQVPTTTPATTTPVAAPPITGPKLSVNTNSLGYLNVRSEPSTAGTVIVKVYPGELYAYSEVKYDWYLITLEDGRTGWVSGTYITKQ